ncbi:MAG: hypothetical protein NT161_03065 [Candidatus Nomurabacteria bacterium]|nr:hypothetical protein [Candidatus Nomurabacteria bacterium]
MNLYQTILLTIAVPIWILTIVSQVCLSREKNDFEKENPSISWRTTKGEKLLKLLKIASVILFFVTFLSFLEIIE